LNAAGPQVPAAIEVAPGVRIHHRLCAYLEREKAVVVSDPHIGAESALQAQGLSLPRFQAGILRRSFGAMIDDLAPERFILNGDLKHDFARLSFQEFKEIKEMVKFLRERGLEVDFIRGNHDNYLIGLARKLDVPIATRLELETAVLAHGDEPEPLGSKVVVIGHEHPAVRLRDAVGASVKVPCFVHSPRIVVLPAVSPLAGGTDVTDQGEFFAPPLKEERVEDLMVTAAGEGELLPLGRLADLEAAAAEARSRDAERQGFLRR
jgi:hypothetical protein